LKKKIEQIFNGNSILDDKYLKKVSDKFKNIGPLKIDDFLFINE
jgi:hypothetical protein